MSQDNQIKSKDIELTNFPKIIFLANSYSLFGSNHNFISQSLSHSDISRYEFVTFWSRKLFWSLHGKRVCNYL